MAKRNEKMRELLKREKDSAQAIRDEYDEREGQLLRDKAQLQQRLDQVWIWKKEIFIVSSNNGNKSNFRKKFCSTRVVVF